SAGHPMGPEDREDQIHALHVHDGKLHATTWPRGKVAALQPNGEWIDCGRLGLSTEINALNVYNGKLYGGTIPRGEVYRFEGGTQWTRIGRFCPDSLAEADDPRLSDRWGRVTSLTAYSGKLFASVGSYTSSIQDAPPDERGRVFAIRAGHCVAYDNDIGGEWRHLAAVRKGNVLTISLDGELVSNSESASSEYDLSNPAPLFIGFGPTDYFSGKIREVRLWKTALEPQEIKQLAAVAP
ncbi:MAG: LamG domain-containing protein, partial [Planctomycetaceae bacterium]